MTENEENIYDSGYSACRAMAIYQIKKILGLNPNDQITMLRGFLSDLEADKEKKDWDIWQREQPQLTRAEYDALLEKALEFGRANNVFELFPGSSTKGSEE